MTVFKSKPISAECDLNGCVAFARNTGIAQLESALASSRHELTHSRREHEQTSAAIETMGRMLDESRQDLGEAVRALEPFSRAGAHFATDIPTMDRCCGEESNSDDYVLNRFAAGGLIIKKLAEASITVRDLRRAREIWERHNAR